MENTIKIIATVLEEFKDIEEKVQKLPYRVREQIQTAESNELLDSIVCTFNVKPGHKIQTFYLPKNVSKITNFDGSENGTLYAYSPEYIFKIEETNLWKFKDFRINWEFID